MHKAMRNSVIALALVSLLVPVPARAAMELISSSVMMETHPVLANFTFPFFAEWEKQSGGAVKVTYFNPGTICASIDMIPSTEKGVVGITVSPISAVPAIFPASSISNLPLMFTNSRAAALTMGEAFATIPQLQQELSKWYVMSATGSVPTNILTTKKPLRVLEDIRGLKIGVSSNDGMEVLKNLGATPVQIQLNDTYLALQRGMIDGCLLPSPTFRSTKVTEVAKYLTVVNLQCSPTPMIMSRTTYNSLPQAAKDVLNGLSLQALSAAGGIFPDYFGDADTQWVVDNHKVQVYVLPPEERARWIAAVEPVQQTWIDRARRQGVDDPEGLLVAFKAIAAKYNDLEMQKQTLDAYREELGPFFPPDKFYNTVFNQ